MSYRNLADKFQSGLYLDVANQASSELDGSPNDELTLSLWGMSLMSLGRVHDAIEVYRGAIRKFPSAAINWSNLGTALRDAGELLAAEDAYNIALTLEPHNARYLANMAFLEIELNNTNKANRLLWEAFNQDPSDLHVKVYGAQTCVEFGRDGDARIMLGDWPAWTVAITAKLGIELASTLIYLGDYKGSEGLLRRFLEDPEYGLFSKVRLVMVLERLNRLPEARKILSDLPAPEDVSDVAAKGELIDAQVIIAVRDGRLSSAREMVESRLSDKCSARWRASAFFMLAKICDAQTDYNACMQSLVEAHKLQSHGLELPGRSESHLSDMSLRIARLRVTRGDGARWGAVKPKPDRAPPIFIVGFPRSGTTLLEQMLDAHPKLHSMDEQGAVQAVISRLSNMGIEYPGKLGSMGLEQVMEMRELYWSFVESVTELDKGKILIDKNPLNMVRLPMIVRMFPDARIIFAIRHPCDVILSCYMQNFRSYEFVSLCSTLEQLSKGYLEAMDSWIYHTELLKPNYMIWRYEDVLVNLDVNIIRLQRFLDLSDVTPLYNFANHALHKGYIATPSYDQVVKPLYRDAVGRWRHYEKVFDTLMSYLRPTIRYWNYDA